jgi:fructose-specific phosphotransferase system IIC component
MTALTLSRTGKDENGAVETASKVSLGGAIVIGIVVGAIIAFVVGGLISNAAYSTSVLQVGHSSVSTNP